MATFNPYADRRVIRTKRKLQEALLALMKTYPLKTISIKKIVSVAGVNRGTFYNHYKSKEELLEEMVDIVVKDLIQGYREPYVNCPSFSIAELNPSMIKLFEAIYKNADFFSQLVCADYASTIQDKLSSVIKELCLHDYTLRCPQINQYLHAVFHAHALAGLIVTWIKDGYHFSPAYMSDQLLKIIKNSGEQIYIIKKRHYMNKIN